jgi:S1-C subfamily serine protease
MINKSFILFLISASFLSCNKQIEPETPEKIFEKYKSSVILVAIEYYYEIDNGNSICYYSPSSEKKIFFSKEDVLNDLSFSTGTGFIISNDGEIITNKHVVNPKDENFKNEIINFYTEAKNKIFYDVQAYNDSLKQIKSNLDEYSDQLEFAEKENLSNKYEYFRERCSFLIGLYGNIENIQFENSTSKLIINRLGIAFDDTHIKNFNDLQECVVIKESNNEDVDLALIQTKSKVFNKIPNSIFNFNDNNQNVNSSKQKEWDINNPIKINDDVFMIGYNKGFTLAITKQGIKSQFTSGKISQDPKNQSRILYTIPTLEGSSGSPIVDKWGNLVAVNFAKITNSQNFSFGIPVKEVKKFYQE